MKTTDLVLHCYAERKHDTWQAFCVDLTLAAQGDSYDDVRQKLESQICDYINDALSIDKVHARELLSRKAPLRYRLKYQFIRLKHFSHNTKNGLSQLLDLPMPVEPKRC